MANYENDDEAKKIMEGITTKEVAYIHFQYQKGLIKTGNKFYVGTGNIKQQIL